MEAMQDLELAVLFAFLNSHDLGGVDEWLRPETYREWAEQRAATAVLDIPDEARPAVQAEVGALAGPTDPSPEDLDRARAIRDALLALLLDPDGASAARAALQRFASGLPLRVHVTSSGRVGLEPTSTGPLAIAARALVLAHDAMADGTWDRLGACRSDDCGWVFIDRSKSHSRQWCSMGECGSRAKARAYRARRRAGG